MRLGETTANCRGAGGGGEFRAGGAHGVRVGLLIDGSLRAVIRYRPSARPPALSRYGVAMCRRLTSVFTMNNRSRWNNAGRFAARVEASRSAFAGAEPLERRRLLSAGSLDPTFGQGGVVLVNDASQFDTTTVASVMQPDGKAVLVGTAKTNTGAAGAVIRLDANGQRDATFGDAGAVTLADPGYASFTATAVAIDASGNLLVVGTAVRRAVRPMAAIARVKPDGSLDATFGDGGWVTIPFGDGAQVNAIAVGQDGQIVVAGASGTVVTLHSGSMAFACLNADGSIKPSFGRYGYAAVPFSLGRRHPDVIPSCAFAATVLSDGRIVAVGGGYLVEATRLTADGAPDPTFGRRGRAVLAGQYGQFNAMTIAPDGSLFATGSLTPSPYGPPEKPGVVTGKFDVGGQPDAHFGRHGAAVTYVGARRYRPATANAGGITLTDDGQVLVSGGVHGARATGAFLARYNADGSLDAGFGSQGVAVAPAAVSSPLYFDSITGVGLLPEPDGGFVVPFDLSVLRAPYVYSFPPLDLHAARFAADGSPDASFGVQGVAPIAGPSGLGQDMAGQVSVAPDGSFYLNGFAGSQIFIGRYRSDGTPDPSFGQGGRIVGLSARAGRIAADPGGTVSESYIAPATGQLVLRNHNADGSLDTTYGIGGTVMLGPDVMPLGSEGLITSFPDGSLLVSGGALSSTFSATTSLVRIDPAGVAVAAVHKTIDSHAGGSSFGDAVVTPDGKALAFVTAVTNGVTSRTLDRYNPDLTLDGTFGQGGVASLDAVPFDTAVSLVTAPDGSIYLAGFTAADETRSDTIARLTAAGQLDTAFGSGGVIRGLPPITQLVVQGDGMPIAASVLGSALSLARYGTDGTPDVTFGAGGRADIDLGETIGSTPNVPAVSLAIERVGGHEALLAAGTLLASPPPASGQNVGPSDGFIARVEL